MHTTRESRRDEVKNNHISKYTISYVERIYPSSVLENHYFLYVKSTSPMLKLGVWEKPIYCTTIHWRRGPRERRCRSV